MTNVARCTVLKAGISTLGGLSAAAAYNSNALAQSLTNTYETVNGEFSVHPVSHASKALNTVNGVIYVDPVGRADLDVFEALLAEHNKDIKVVRDARYA
jgi:hypothetical protein